VNAGIGGMGEPWAGGSGSPGSLEGFSEAAWAAGQLADPVHGGIRPPSARLPFRSEDFPLGPSRLPAPAERAGGATMSSVASQEAHTAVDARTARDCGEGPLRIARLPGRSPNRTRRSATHRSHTSSSTSPSSASVSGPCHTSAACSRETSRSLVGQKCARTRRPTFAPAAWMPA
jgi:hypothetical protein